VEGCEGGHWGGLRGVEAIVGGVFVGLIAYLGLSTI